MDQNQNSNNIGQGQVSNVNFNNQSFESNVNQNVGGGQPVDNGISMPTSSNTAQVNSVPPAQVNSDSVQSNSASSKKLGQNKKLIIIIASVVGVLVMGAIVYFAFIAPKIRREKYLDPIIDWEKEEEEIKKQEEENAKTIKKNLKYSVESKLADGTLLVSLESTNKDFINAALKFKFYDQDKVQLDESEEYFNCVEAGEKLYVLVYAPDDYDSYEFLEDSMELEYSKDFNKCIAYKGKYESTISLNDDEYSVIVKNNTDKVATISGYVLYYKNNSVFDAEIVNFKSVVPGGSAKDEAYLPYDEDYNDIIPDDAKFVLSRVTID